MTGPATIIIGGVAEGMLSTWVPVLVVLGVVDGAPPADLALLDPVEGAVLELEVDPELLAHGGVNAGGRHEARLEGGFSGQVTSDLHFNR